MSTAGRARATLALAITLAMAAGSAAHAQGRTRETTFTCQGGGAMVVDLAPATNGQIWLSIHAALADPADQTPSPGTCVPADGRFHDRAQQANFAAGLGSGGQRPMLRLATRQPLVLAVQIAADQSPRVTLSSQRSDARAEQTLQLYDSAVQGRVFTVTAREGARNPLELAITGSAAR
jgi:hypothetical protein